MKRIKKNHPFQIQCGPNPMTGKWDIILSIGNYKSEADALKDVEVVKDFMTGDGDFGWADRVN